MIRGITISVFLLICLVAMPAMAGDDSIGFEPPNDIPYGMWAQAGGPPDSGPLNNEPPDMERRRQHLEQLRMLKLLEMLDLDEDQELAFITGFRRMREQLEELETERHSVLDDLSQHIEGNNVDDRVVESASQQLVQIAERKIEVVFNFFDRSRKTLTPEQSAKLMVFQERFDRELLERIRAFHDRGIGRGKRSGSKQ